MSHERQTERFLSGGLNVLAPGDLLPAEDAMECLNWRCDQAGQLRSRKREEAIDTHTYVTPIHTIFDQNITLPYRFTGGGSSLYRNEAVVATGFDGWRLGLVNFDNQLWVMNRTSQGRISADTGVYTRWLPAPATVGPSAAAGGGTGLTGDYQYFVTFDTVEGYESDVSTSYGSIAALANQSVNLTAIPVSADANVTARHIYRQGGYQDQLYRVGTINDNVTTTFADTMTDEAAARLGITHGEDHQPPPGCRGLVGMYYDKLIAFSSLEHRNWFWWTPSDTPWYWPGSDLDEGNHAPVGEDGEEILVASIKARMVLFYKERSIWRMIGDPDDNSGRLEQIHGDLAIVGPSAWATDGTVDYIVGDEGVYLVNGDTARKVSEKLDPIFKGDSIKFGAAHVKQMNQDAIVRAKTVLAMRNGRLYLSYADYEHTAPNVTLVLNIETGQWFQDDRGFSALCSESRTGGHLVGAIDDQLYIVEGGGTQSMTLAYQSRYTDQGSPENLKMYSDLVLEYDTGGAELQVNALYDRGTTGEELGVISSTGLATTVFPINVTGREAKNFSFRLDGSATGDVFMYSAHLHYYVNARESLTYDSEIQDLGPKIHQVAQIGVAIETGGAAVTWHFYNDSSGVLAEVDHGTIPDLVGRQRPEYPLSRQWEGRLVRVVLTSTRPFKLYGVSLWARPIGLFVPRGTRFDLPPMDFGSKRYKLMRQIALELNGSLAVSAATDLIAPSTQTIAGVNVWAKAALAPRFRGRDLRLSFVANSDTRVYRGKVQAKVIGEAASSSWEWHAIAIEPTPEIFNWIALPVPK